MELAANEYRAACRGCHGGCVHILTVEDGKVVSIRPDPDAPLNKGQMCAKGATIIEQMYHPDRLTHPMKRVGERGSGKWEQITWDEAYDTIASRLTELKEQYGPESIAMFTGTGRHHMAHFWRFANVLGTPNGSSAGAVICLDPRVFSVKWTAGDYAVCDYYGDVKPKGVLVWGANPAISGADGELQWKIKDAVKAGAEILVIDPKPTELTPYAKLWLRPRPGTDGALAMGMLNVIIHEELYDEEFVDNYCYGFGKFKGRVDQYSVERVSKITWVPEEQIIAAARWVAQTKPLTLEWGCAIEHSMNSIQTCRAIFAMIGITGNYDVPGGFVKGKNVGPTADKLDDLRTEETKSKCLAFGVPHLQDAAMSHPRAVLKAMREGIPYKIRGLLVHANNSLLSMPDASYTYEALKELDFMVCMDIFMTPTAEMADIVLPAALWPEIDEIFTMPEFADHTALCMQKVVQVGECKSDEEVFFELSKRMGLDYHADSLKDIYNDQLKEMGRLHPEIAGVSFDEFKKIGYLTPKRTYYNYKLDGFNTPTGKFELYSNQLKEEGGDPLPWWDEVSEGPKSRPDLYYEYPLVLTTGGRLQQYFISNNRQITSLRSQWPFPRVSMSPETGKKYGLEDGDWAWIETPRGRITQKVLYCEGMDPKVVSCEMGWWYPEAGAPDYGWTESNANMLTLGNGPFDPCFGSYQLRAMLCRVSPNPDCTIEERYYNSKYYRKLPVDSSSNSIVVDPSKCILCSTCVNVCNNIQTVGVLQLVTKNGSTYIEPGGSDDMISSKCVCCGQCRANCPTGAISIKSSVQMVKEAIADKDTIVVAQVAPSVRVGISRAVGLPAGTNAIDLVSAAMRRIGFNAVYDTTFSADLTIFEEAAELVERIKSGSDKPLFTSCCPAWVKFCETQYPELADCISTTRSPQQMMGAVLQEFYSRPGKNLGKKVRFVSVMPCTAKKDEILRAESTTGGRQDVDWVITTNELKEMIDEAGIDMTTIDPIRPDHPYGTGSGGGVIFGVSGGVTEAALRYLMPEFGENEDMFIQNSGVRVKKDLREFNLNYQGKDLHIAIASGLGNARKLLERVKAGEHFDLIEVMACPGGCIMGGGQPTDIYHKKNEAKERSNGLYHADYVSGLRRSNDNIEVKNAYETVIGDRSHELLHRNFEAAKQSKDK